jgi:hypothetical protein
VVENNLVEHLAAGYRAFHLELAASGKLARMPKLLEYKVLRGFQTHDLHHVLTGYPGDPTRASCRFRRFQLAQMDYPVRGDVDRVVAGT